MLIDAIGIIELNSIAKGYEVADKISKASFVELVMCKTTCPGKFLIIVSGDVSSVNTSIETSKEISGKSEVASFVINNPHEDILKNINRRIINKENINSIGVVEHSSIASSMRVLDKALKSADVELIKFIPGNLIGGRSYFIISGELSSIKESIENSLNEIGKDRLINFSIISAPSIELIQTL